MMQPVSDNERPVTIQIGFDVQTLAFSEQLRVLLLPHPSSQREPTYDQILEFTVIYNLVESLARHGACNGMFEPGTTWNNLIRGYIFKWYGVKYP
jgi:hypothetical protein